MHLEVSQRTFRVAVWGLVHFDVAQRAFRVAGVGNRARSVRFAWQAWGRVCAGLRGPAREMGCARVRRRTGRCEIVAGAGNPWISGRKLGADVSQNVVAE